VNSSMAVRFRRVINRAYEQTGKIVVVLVDDVFKGFFRTLKSYDRYLKFVFITEVTNFSKGASKDTVVIASKGWKFLCSM